MNETALPHHIALRQPADLPFPDQMHRFVTIDRPQCSFCRPEQVERIGPLCPSVLPAGSDTQFRKKRSG
jgi:hypothetical protein